MIPTSVSSIARIIGSMYVQSSRLTHTYAEARHRINTIGCANSARPGSAPLVTREKAERGRRNNHDKTPGTAVRITLAKPIRFIHLLSNPTEIAPKVAKGTMSSSLLNPSTKT